MKQKKVRKIINEAIGFIHQMSDDTVSQKEGKKVIKRLQKIKFCDLHVVNTRFKCECGGDDFYYRFRKKRKYKDGTEKDDRIYCCYGCGEHHFLSKINGC